MRHPGWVLIAVVAGTTASNAPLMAQGIQYHTVPPRPRVLPPLLSAGEEARLRQIGLLPLVSRPSDAVVARDSNRTPAPDCPMPVMHRDTAGLAALYPTLPRVRIDYSMPIHVPQCRNSLLR
jgi:hypothetical protein